MSGPTILHESATRLRLQPRVGANLDELGARLGALGGVENVRTNRRLGCIVVQHDGKAGTRTAVLKAMRARAPAAGERRGRERRGDEVAWAPGVLAAAVLLLPAGLRPGGALGVVATRVATQREHLKTHAPAVLLDAASLAALAVSGQPVVVLTSVLLRLLAETLSGRLVRQADGLLEQLLPAPADQYRVLRDGDGRQHWWPLRRVRAGDRVRLYPGDLVPVDGSITDGQATVHPVAEADAPRVVAPGAHVAAGERVVEGTFELRAETDAAGSRLERLRAQLEHTIGARDPAGPMAANLQRVTSLPLTGAALVFGLTGDTARAAAMLQSDPQQGLDLALPLAREAALYALARHGLVTAGLETIERLAAARTLVLQDTSVLATGRWTVEGIDTEPGGDAALVRRWFAALAGVPEAALTSGGLPDALVRQWVRHGALMRLDAHELHLASARRLRRVWELAMDDRAAAGTVDRDGRTVPPGLRRTFGVVANGRVVARVALANAWRDGASQRLDALRKLGFERIGIFAEDDGGDASVVAPPTRWCNRPDIECLADDALVRGEWLADAVREGAPLVMLHTVLRDLVPPGSLSLTPAEADVGAHGVLLGDPLVGLVTARRLAGIVHRRLRVQQNSAVGTNALLMTAAALHWLPPIATALLHHGFALLVLLDSLRIEALEAAQVSRAKPEAESSTSTVPRDTLSASRSITA